MNRIDLSQKVLGLDSRTEVIFVSTLRSILHLLSPSTRFQLFRVHIHETFMNIFGAILHRDNGNKYDSTTD